MPTKNVWVGPSSLADEAREFLGTFERDLFRTISLDHVPSRQARLREVAVDGPGEIDPPPEGLVDRSNRLRGHSRDQGACRKLGVSRTTAPLATTDPEPIRAPLLIVEFMPTRQSSPMEQPWTTAAWPTVTRRPITAGMPRSTCTTPLSWTFESLPTPSESKSPRSTARGQT